MAGRIIKRYFSVNCTTSDGIVNIFMPMETLEKYITRKEVAKDFGVSVKCVYLWEKRYNIPSTTIGKTVLYKKEDIEKLLFKSK